MTTPVKSQTFAIGQMVEWTSQAGGNTRTKIGVVMGILPAGASIRTIPYFNQMNINTDGFTRKHESYVIAEVHPHRKPKFFWPYTHQLQKAKRYFPVVLNKKHLALKKPD